MENGTPDGPKLHSVIVDPRDRKHLYVAMSSGGVHESLDRGATWKALVKGMEVVEGFPADQLYVHDPHCVRLCPSNPDRLYQQNHCGIYRLDRPGEEWTRIGRNMPAEDRRRRLPDGGASAQRQGVLGVPDGWQHGVAAHGHRRQARRLHHAQRRQELAHAWTRGCPTRDAWWTVKRQAMCGDTRDPVGLYVGTTSGEIWASRDEGASWRCIARHLPEIYALECAEL